MMSSAWEKPTEALRLQPVKHGGARTLPVGGADVEHLFIQTHQTLYRGNKY